MWDAGRNLDMCMLLTNFASFPDILLGVQNKLHDPIQILLCKVIIAI